MANYPMIKTEKSTTYFVGNTGYVFDNDPKILEALNQITIEDFVEENFKSIVRADNFSKDVAFVKQVNGRDYLFPTRKEKYRIEEKLLTEKSELFKDLSPLDIFTIFQENNVTEDGKFCFKLYCSEEEFSNRAVLDVKLASIKNNKTNQFMIFVKVPMNETVGFQVDLNSPNIEILEKVWIGDSIKNSECSDF